MQNYSCLIHLSCEMNLIEQLDKEVTSYLIIIRSTATPNDHEAPQLSPISPSNYHKIEHISNKALDYKVDKVVVICFSIGNFSIIIAHQ